MTLSTAELIFTVPDMNCGHCRAAIIAEVERVPGIGGVDVDLEAKLVRVHGEAVDAAAVRAAIDEAGYAAVP
jgi:copper chaperone CopZ